MQPHFLTAVLFEALVGTALGVFLGFHGGWIGPWLGRIMYPGGPGEYQMVYSALGLLGGSILGIAGGVYATGRALGQTGAWWAALLGSLLGAVLVGVPMTGLLALLGPVLPFLSMWGLIGGGALILALAGYNRTRRFPPGAWWGAVLLGSLLGVVLGYGMWAVLGSP